MDSNICVVVGVGPGVGLAVAKRFGRKGYRLGLIARRADALQQYVLDLQESGITAQGFVADAADFGSLRRALADVRTELGDPAVLVYNPAVIHAGPPSTLKPDDLVEDFRVNVAGALVCAQAVLPAMQAAKQGTILFTGGGLALTPYPDYASLAVGKAGLRNLAYSLGAELAPAGIQVATVTIAGFVQPGSHFDPELIAEKYWSLHAQDRDQRETVYR